MGWEQAGEELRLADLSGHRIMPSFAPGVAARQARQRQVSAACGPVLLERLQRISGTGRREAAARAQPRAEQQSIALHQGNEDGPDHGSARAKSPCNSPRTARFRTWEEALMNCARSKPARSRTTWAAAGSVGRAAWLTV